MLGGVELGVAGTASAPEDRRRRRAVRARFLQRKRGRAEGALGGQAADEPVRPSASGAVIHFPLVINGMVSASIRIERGTASLNRTQHGAFLRNHLTTQRASSRSVSVMIGD